MLPIAENSRSGLSHMPKNGSISYRDSNGPQQINKLKEKSKSNYFIQKLI